MMMWEYQGRKWELDLEEYETAVRFRQALETLAREEAELGKKLASEEAPAFCRPEGIREYVEIFQHFFTALFGEEGMEEILGGRCNARECDEAYLSLVEYLNSQAKVVQQRKARFLAYQPQTDGAGRTEGKGF